MEHKISTFLVKQIIKLRQVKQLKKIKQIKIMQARNAALKPNPKYRTNCPTSG